MVIKDPNAEKYLQATETQAVAKADKVSTVDGGPEDLDPLED
ncbi:hypothetical protein ACT3SY_14415 [Brachybacterium sp. AOP42-E1-35]|nr:hypothetical protein [uncultured Brachybacterium sp.]